MKNIFIDYLTDTERKRSDILLAREGMRMSGILYDVNSKKELEDLLNGLDLLDVAFLSINSHGYRNEVAGIVNDSTRVNFVKYSEFVTYLNTTINGNRVIINLVGVCNSYLIEKEKQHLNKTYSEIWVSNDETPSYNATIQSINEGLDFIVEHRELPLKKIIL